MDYSKELIELKKNIEKASKFKVEAQVRLEALDRERAKLLDELKNYGIDPAELDTEIERLEKEIEDGIEEIKKLLPMDKLEGKNE